MRFVFEVSLLDSFGGCEIEVSGFPGFSSHVKGIEATSLAGGGTGLDKEALSFQSFLGIPGLSSQRNGTEGGCLTRFFLGSSTSFSGILGGEEVADRLCAIASAVI
ncbi:hypothetical protein NL676_000119 [Syzygium grande]|nr:hypothetical protein NL676_000119 [Syzygium grande]